MAKDVNVFTPYSPEASCIGKVRFESRGLATAVQDRRKRGRKTQCRNNQIYKCPACHGWHLGTPMRKRA